LHISLIPAIFKDTYGILHSPDPFIKNDPMIILSRLSNELTHARLGQDLRADRGRTSKYKYSRELIEKVVYCLISKYAFGSKQLTNEEKLLGGTKGIAKTGKVAMPNIRMV
jgi:hypothetical protein